MTASYFKHDLAPIQPSTVTARATTEDFAGRTDGRGGGFLRRALAALGSLGRREAVLNELSSLTDYELADIGLSRSTIHRVFDADFAEEHRARG